MARLGSVDILVSNAGIGLRRSLEQFSLEEFRGLLDVNLTSAFLVARAVAPGMIARRQGKIITVCSVMSELARETVGVYSATKGGLKMLTRGMCADWARFNIQANAIGPGYFRTELNEPLCDEPDVRRVAAQARPRRPLGRAGRARGRGRLPRLARVGLRERPDPVRRRRHDCGCLTSSSAAPRSTRARAPDG